MNITLTITGGTAAEIKQAVSDLSNSFEVDVKGELQETKPAKSKKAETVPAPKAETAPETKEAEIKDADKVKSVSLEIVRAAVQEKAQAGKRTEVKALLTEMGAENVTALEKEKYSDFLTKLNAL